MGGSPSRPPAQPSAQDIEQRRRLSLARIHQRGRGQTLLTGALSPELGGASIVQPSLTGSQR